MIEVFEEITNRNNGQVIRTETTLGTFNEPYEDQVALDGRKVRINLSMVNTRMRGPKSLGVEVEGYPSKFIGLKRLTGGGYQTVSTDIRIGVRMDSPIGILVNEPKPKPLGV